MRTNETEQHARQQFSQVIDDCWIKPFISGRVITGQDGFTIAINPDLDTDERVMVLETSDGRMMAAADPQIATKISLTGQEGIPASVFRANLNEAGIAMHGADYLFFFTNSGKVSLSGEGPDEGLRRLTPKDEAAFAEFMDAVPEQDKDDAFVELNHWLVFGIWEEQRIVCAASMYPWNGARIADTGVLTLPASRGKGHARRIIRAISRYACEQGYEPQYRCQTDNLASIALARSAGLMLFGKWEIISPESQT